MTIKNKDVVKVELLKYWPPPLSKKVFDSKDELLAVGKFVIIKTCIVYCGCVHTDDGVIVATGRAWRKKKLRWGGEGSLWLAELVLDGFGLAAALGAWHADNLALWRCVVMASQHTVREVPTPGTPTPSPLRGFVFQAACHTCFTYYGNIIGLV